LQVSIRDDEEKIRAFFRGQRDKLKQRSAELSLMSHAGYSEAVKTLFAVQSAIFDWLVDVYGNTEKLFLELHGFFQQYEPTLKDFTEYLETVRREQERLR